ncbi:hypothetical protein [Mycolicibacter kumamotonensis]|uniref:Uncharacterized protein n=1 Tax=Mycolicibacter kumamotonensis TaxID=354243 RepID=A0A1B8SBC8_9MYCO|nr:hypothetical protein [Mycolicibacter kumamotonensis]OBY30043.1 hypothetical protein ACT18_19905 [Mycolicibacter kumamotonensis]
MPDTNGVDRQHDQQHDSLSDDQAGDPAPASTDDNRTPASERDDDTADDQDDDQDDGSRSNREKRYRLRLRDAERERDELRDTLTRTRQAIVDTAVQAVGLDPRLLAAAGHTLDTLVGDDGLIDPAKLSEAVTVTAREFRITPKGRPPQPNRQQGTGSGQPPAKSSWADAIKGS